VGPDEAWRRLTSCLFEEAGYAVFSAADQQQAVAFTTQLLPDVVVVQMETPDTLDVLARLSEGSTTYDIPVVVLTSSLQSSKARRAREAGALTLLAHPAEGGVLVGEVNTLIAEVPRAQRTLKRLLLEIKELARYYSPSDDEGESRLRHLIDQLQVAILAVDKQGHCIAASQGATTLIVRALLEFGDATQEGPLVRAVALPWFRILDSIRRDPRAAYEIDPRTWEEIIAGAYRRAGFDQVILTPRSGDKGRDVIATKNGVGSIRIFDQVKAYKPGHVVTAEEVRAMLGVITGAGNVSKGVITTTSMFAPRVTEDEYIRPFLPYRLELKPRDVLLGWLDELGHR
jgi:restriction system protein